MTMAFRQTVKDNVNGLISALIAFQENVNTWDDHEVEVAELIARFEALASLLKVY